MKLGSFKSLLRSAVGLVEFPSRFGNADDRHLEVTALQHRLERREDFLVGEVARGAEKHKSVGMGCVHPEHGWWFQQEVTEETERQEVVGEEDWQ